MPQYLYRRSLGLTGARPLAGPDGFDTVESFDAAVSGIAGGLGDGALERPSGGCPAQRAASAFRPPRPGNRTAIEGPRNIR